MADDILSKAIGATSKIETGGMKGVLPETPEVPVDDGTVTIPSETLPDVKDGDIVQFTVITTTDEGIVLKPVESRIKQEGADSKDVKAAGSDNSVESVGTPIK